MLREFHTAAAEGFWRQKEPLRCSSTNLVLDSSEVIVQRVTWGQREPIGDTDDTAMSECLPYQEDSGPKSQGEASREDETNQVSDPLQVLLHTGTSIGQGEPRRLVRANHAIESILAQDHARGNVNQVELLDDNAANLVVVSPQRVAHGTEDQEELLAPDAEISVLLDHPQPVTAWAIGGQGEAQENKGSNGMSKPSSQTRSQSRGKPWEPSATDFVLDQRQGLEGDAVHLGQHLNHPNIGVHSICGLSCKAPPPPPARRVLSFGGCHYGIGAGYHDDGSQAAAATRRGLPFWSEHDSIGAGCNTKKRKLEAKTAWVNLSSSLAIPTLPVGMCS